jgi:hypothetical protein
MERQNTNLNTPAQNIGLTDRITRFFVGGALLAIGALLLVEQGVTGSAVGIMLSAIYPLMTTMMGWDPLYQITGAKTCNLDGRNACGTFPYEVDAALGNKPIPK